MKIKLLKKIRKRFEINHHPKGMIINDKRIDSNIFELIDKGDRFEYTWLVNVGEKKMENIYNNIGSFRTERECIDYLKNTIIIILRKEGFRGKKDKLITKNFKKVWYNDKNNF
jgi:hypothetical protein